MTEFKNDFSWSKSRDECLKQCKRKYYFNHYGFWNGWINSEDDRKKRIYYLKQLNTKEIWLGQIIHEIIEHVLKQHRQDTKITLGHALSILKKRFDNGFLYSKLKEYTGFRSKIHKFFEDEYDIPITEEKKQELYKKAETCITNFYNSDIFIEIKNTPTQDWITLEDFLSFNFEENKIYLSIDFAMKKDDEIILYDWKTGKERFSDYKLQLACYSLYVSQKFNINPLKIKAKIFNLAIDKEDTFKITEEVLDEMKLYIKGSIKNMKNLLNNPTENTALEESFPKAEDYHCKRCNYYKVCLGEWRNKQKTIKSFSLSQ